MTHGDLEAEGPPSSSGKETWGRETPAAPGISEPAGGSTQGVPGLSLSGLLDPLGPMQAGGCSGSHYRASSPPCRPAHTAHHLPQPWSWPSSWLECHCQHSSRGGWCVRPAQAHGRKGQHGPPTMTVTTDESTKAARGGQRPPQEDTPWWHPGPAPRSVQPPRSKARRRYGLARG